MPMDGLRLLRDRAPTGMEIGAGECGYDSGYFRRVLEAGAVDVLQADATRCAGVTGSAPSLQAHLCCAALSARNVEYFHDHVRIEAMSFDGAAKARNGMIQSTFYATVWVSK
jgi:hypothetical protein